MSYDEKLEIESLEHNYLAILTVRRLHQSTWELHATNVYKTAWPFGEALKVYLLTEDNILEGTGYLVEEDRSRPNLQSLQFNDVFYHPEEETLYFKSSSDPNNFVNLIDYRIFVATKPVNWYTDPLDSTSKQIHYEGLIDQAPTLQHSQADTVFGFVPISMSSLVCLDVQGFWSKHLYDSSFHLSKVKLYHWIDRLKIDNLKYFITGYLKSFTVNDTDITFEMLEPQELLNRQMQLRYYPASVDAVYSQKPIRRFYGMSDSVPLVNVTVASVKYNTITASSNHTWAIGTNLATEDIGTNGANISNVQHAPTRTYVDGPTPFNIGDDVRLADAYFPRYTTITGLGPNYIDHLSVGDGLYGAGVASRYAEIGSVNIVQNGKRFFPMPFRDYDVSSGGDYRIVAFKTGFEANVGMATLTAQDTVVARVYGTNHYPRYDIQQDGSGGEWFGTVPEPDSFPVVYNGVVILYGLLKEAGIKDTEIDLEAFETLAEEVTQSVGFAVPATSTQVDGTYRDTIVRILKSLMLQLFINHQGKWTLRKLGPLKENPDQTFTELDIDDGSFSYRLSYDDLVSRVNVRYRYMEMNVEVANQIGEVWSSVSVESTLMRYLHQASRVEEYDTVLVYEDDAIEMAERIALLLSDRRGILTIEGGNLLRSTEISDTVLIQRPLMPGLIFDGSPQSRKFTVVETSKGLNAVSLTLEDQKGIEDNSGDW